MALTRKALSAMGIEDEKIEQIIAMHTETVNALKDERDNLKASAEKLPAVQKELDELKESTAAESPYKKQYEDALKEKETLEAEYTSYKADVEAREAKEKQRGAFRKLLAEAGVSEKRIDSVLRLAEVDGKLDTLEFDGDELKDAEELTKAIEKDYADYIVREDRAGAKTPQPPAKDGSNPATPSKASMMAAKYHANLYGEAKED